MGDEEGEALPGVYSIETDAGTKPTSIGYSGKGKATYPNGDTYQGAYDTGVRQGDGVYTCRATGDIFTGKYEKNLKVGLGRVDYKAGGFYHGYFKEGMRDGDGTFKYANGDIYCGQWKAGKKHGQGTYIYANTKYELKGDWKNGQLDTGTWKFTDGTTYSGGFKYQKPFGDGSWSTRGGSIVEGGYVQSVVPIDERDVNPDGTPAHEFKVYWKTAAVVSAEE